VHPHDLLAGARRLCSRSPLGGVSKKGTPVPALVVSAGGLGLATLFAISFPSSAYVYMFGIALFGGFFRVADDLHHPFSFRRHWTRRKSYQ